jgi:hypothetical protein
MMQPDHESDELQALLREEYAAPPLDQQFSADLVTRLQAEASSPQTPSLAPTKSRRSLLAICLGIAAIAASIIAVLLILNQKPQGTNREVARRVKSNSLSTHMELDTFSAASENERLESRSLNSRPLSLSESLSHRPERESKPYSESKVPTQEYLREEARPEHLVEEERAPAPLPKATLSVLSTILKEWPNVSAAVALADKLYVVDCGHLYEVSPKDGSRRMVGNDDWQNAAAIGTAGGRLFMVNDHQLFEVDPKTGTRRTLGKPDWTDTRAIETFGDKLYIASRGQLYRVDPKDGSREVLPSKTESLNRSPEPKP